MTREPSELDALDEATAARLHAEYERARSTWPEVDLPRSCYAEAVRTAVATGACGLDELRLDDLFLACACAQGIPSAVAALRRDYFGDVQAALHSLGLRGASLDDLEQEVFDEAVTAVDGRAPIAGFTGRGPLRRWLRSVAVRKASRRHRSEQRDVEMRRQIEHVLPQYDDAELDHLKRRYTRDYGVAVAEAIRSLDVADRLLLKHYFLDGLTIDELAGMFAIHRSTAARRVQRARDRAYAGTVDRLRDRLGMSPSEVADVGRFVRSQLELSLPGLLGQTVERAQR